MFQLKLECILTRALFTFGSNCYFKGPGEVCKGQTLEADSLINCLAEFLQMAGTVMTHLISRRLISYRIASFNFSIKCFCNKPMCAMLCENRA